MNKTDLYNLMVKSLVNRNFTEVAAQKYASSICDSFPECIYESTNLVRGILSDISSAIDDVTTSISNKQF